MAHGDFKDLRRRTVSDKVLCDKALNIAKNPKFDGYQRGLSMRLLSVVYRFFDIKSSSSGFVKNEIKQNKKIAENHLLGNLKNKKYTHLLKIIFGVLNLLICD